jgi:hypothetical protein
MTNTRCCDLATGRLLRVDPRDEFVGDAFGRELLVAEGVVERLLRRVLVRVLLRIDLRQHLRQPTTNGHQVFAALLAAPRHAVQRLERLRELVEKPPLVQATLDARDDEVLAEADVSIELGEEDLADGVRVRQGLAALDLERNGADLRVQLDLTEPQADVLAALAVREVLHEGVDAALSVGAQLVVLEQVAEHLGEVRLAGAEEARHPHANHVTRSTATSERLADLGERVDDALQLVLDLVGDDVLANLVRERRAVEHLDDALDLHTDVALDDFSNGGHVLALPGVVVLPQRANSLTAR